MADEEDNVPLPWVTQKSLKAAQEEKAMMDMIAADRAAEEAAMKAEREQDSGGEAGGNVEEKSKKDKKSKRDKKSKKDKKDKKSKKEKKSKKDKKKDKKKSAASSSSSSSDSEDGEEEDPQAAAAAERQLRALKQPVRLFGESPEQRLQRIAAVRSTGGAAAGDRGSAARESWMMAAPALSGEDAAGGDGGDGGDGGAGGGGSLDDLISGTANQKSSRVAKEERVLAESGVARADKPAFLANLELDSVTGGAPYPRPTAPLRLSLLPRPFPWSPHRPPHRPPCRLRSHRARDAASAAPPSLPYKVDTSRPSLRTNWTRRGAGPKAGGIWKNEDGAGTDSTGGTAVAAPAAPAAPAAAVGDGGASWKARQLKRSAPEAPPYLAPTHLPPLLRSFSQCIS